MRYLAVLSIIFISAINCTIAYDPSDCDFGDTYYSVFKFGQHNCSCEPKKAGQVKYAGGEVLVCTGSEWRALQFKPAPYGQRSNPGYSCKDIKKTAKQDSNGIYWITSNNKRASFPVYCDMAAGGWTMVFKAVSRSSQNVYNTYISGQTYNENNMAALDVTSKHLSHYKNRIVLNWERFGPSEARVVLYKEGKLMKELKFDALGSDKLNWFTDSRLSKSPWSDINTQPKNFFSIGGMHQRYFFINRNYGGCGVDAGWMAVTAGIHCNWEKHFQPSRDVQVILYSKLSGHTNWNHFGNVGVADTLVVYLR